MDIKKPKELCTERQWIYKNHNGISIHKAPCTIPIR